MLVHAAVSVSSFLAILAVGVLGPHRLGRGARRVGGLLRRLHPAPPPPPGPRGRPIEQIARDANRLGRRLDAAPTGRSFARYEGCRRAYDLVLGEACAALEVDHLLGVITLGPDLDAERQRVEWVLSGAGLRLYRVS